MKEMTEAQRKKAIIRTLECSAELLSQPKKWVRGVEKDGRGEKARFCAIGAVQEVVTKLQLPESIRVRAIHHLDMTIRDNKRMHAESIVEYNDDYAKSAKSVANVMLKTAKRLKKKQEI